MTGLSMKKISKLFKPIDFSNLDEFVSYA